MIIFFHSTLSAHRVSKMQDPFENKDIVLTFTLEKNKPCMQLSYTKGKYFKFHKDMTIHKILVEGQHQTQQLPFQ